MQNGKSSWLGLLLATTVDGINDIVLCGILPSKVLDIDTNWLNSVIWHDLRMKQITYRTARVQLWYDTIYVR